jgi:membrane protein
VNVFQRALIGVDTYQRRHPGLGFPYAVVKKYGEDNAGYQSAIITYYGLLSLFPLLIVFTTVSQLLLKSDARLRSKVSAGIARYFPIIGNQLQDAVHSPRKAGAALAISLLITLYGARGVASAFQYSTNLLWHISPADQPPFLKNMARGFGIILTGAIGVLAAMVLSGYTALLGHTISVKVLATVGSALLLWVTLIVLFKLSIAGNKSIRAVALGAGIAAIGLQVLQSIGGILLAHELKSLNTVDGTFALVIALLFWIYLQVEVILYAIEVDVVRAYHLFPRSLQGALTDSDEVAYTKYAQAQAQRQNEKVRVSFWRSRHTEHS